MTVTVCFPLLLRVQLDNMHAFEHTPNRFRRGPTNPVTLPVARRERRAAACERRRLRAAIGDENYAALMFALDSSNYPTFDKDPVARHFGFVEGVPGCQTGARGVCTEHGWRVVNGSSIES